MEEWFRVVVQFLHVLTGVLWIGAGFYTILVQLPALNAVPPPARGQALATIAPRQVRYMLRIGEATIATGMLNSFATGRAREFDNVMSSRWAMAITVGAVLAIALYVLAQAVIRPTVERLLSGSGEPGPLVARLRRVGQIQIAIGAVIVFVMVLARFS